MLNFRQYRKIDPNEFFVVAADTSSGMSDYCAAQFLSKTNLDVPLIYHAKVLANDMTNSLLPVLEKIFDVTKVKPMVAYERNNGGVFEIERLAGLNRNGKFDIFRMPNTGSINNPDPVKLGWDTNTASRPKMLSDLKDAIDKKLLTIYDKPTINEMFSFIITKTSTSEKAQAEVGAHDDLVMSLAIAWQLYQMCPTPVKNQTGGIPYEQREFGVYTPDAYR